MAVLPASATGTVQFVASADALVIWIRGGAGQPVFTGAAYARLIGESTQVSGAAVSVVFGGEQVDASEVAAGVVGEGDRVDAGEAAASVVGEGERAEAGEAAASVVGTGDRVEAGEVLVVVSGHVLGVDMGVDLLQFVLEDRTGGYKGILKDAARMSYSEFIGDNAGGGGRFEYPLDDPLAGQIKVSDLIQVRYRGIKVGYWLVENIEKDAVRRVVTVTGRSILATLEKALVYPLDMNQFVLERQFTNATAGTILGTLLSEFDNRGGGVLSWDFTPTQDSDGNAWSETHTVTLRVGQNLLDVVKLLWGLDVACRVDATRTLKAYDPNTVHDKGRGIFFQEGRNILEARVVENGADLVTVALGASQDTFMEKLGSYVNTYGRLEGFAQVSQIDNLDDALTRLLEDQGAPIHSVSLRVSSDPRPLIDYVPGDIVKVKLPGLLDAKYRVVGVTLSQSDQGVDVVLDLNSLLLDIIERIQKVIETQVVYGLIKGPVMSPVTKEPAKARETHAHAASDLPSDIVYQSTNAQGDVTGPYTGLVVVGLQGRPVASTAPNTDEVLKWDGIQWKPAPDTGGGGGSSKPIGVDDGLWPFAKPQVADFTWVNQGGATATDKSDGVFLNVPSVGHVDNLRILKKSLGGLTQFTVTMAYIPYFPAHGWPTCGLLLRESASGKLVLMRLWLSDLLEFRVYASRFNSATSFNSNITQINMPYFADRIYYMRFRQDATTRYYELSWDDGRTWHVLTSTAASDFISPDEVGFFVDSYNDDGHWVGMLVVHFDVV